jgi:NADH-quinone oxidoreductase subunit G
LEANATASVRYAPGAGAEFAAALERALDGAADVTEEIGALATLLRDGGEDVVIVWGERIGAAAAAALGRIARRLGLAEREGAGLLMLPAGANGRGLREAGAVPDAGPGYGAVETPGRSAAEIGAAAAGGEITALHLFGTDPVRDQPDRALWERAMHSAALVVAHASVLTEGLAEHATVIFPAESHAEKEGTLVHPDGRLQRQRIAIAHPGEVRPAWWVLCELAAACGLDTGIERASDVFAQLVAAVPFYEGLTLDEIGGRGVRWPERPQASMLSAHLEPEAGHDADVDGDADASERPAQGPSPRPAEDEAPLAGMLALGTYRPIWASPEVEISPALKYLVPSQQVELSPADARRLHIADGEEVVVGEPDDAPAAHSGEAGRRAGGNGAGTRLHARAVVRSTVPEGSVFLAEGLPADSANMLTAASVEVHKP